MPPAHPTSLRFSRLLLTGAAGGLGQVLRPRLKAYCDRLRVSDIAALGEPAAGEEVQQVRLEDPAAVHEMLAGVDAVVHLGGYSVEGPFEPILQANIVGLYHLYEAARRHGVRRVVYASSNHVTGYYRQDEVIDTRALPRPDGLYGVSKAFGENLASFYFDRYGIETACLRIGSSTPRPLDRRMLATWLSHDDLERLVVSCLTAPVVGHSIIYGVSDNGTRWWDNRHAAHLGYVPRDSADAWRAEVEARQPVLDLQDPAVRHQGGVFLHAGPFGD
ncbi:NAD-dependent epimerase/dehydratase family protein [Eleftheria terrae]|uniref:NAD-dependent epimerase/dehydratase family protein n=1 Tax=Eleftheria terrae TaxID=1597781 RepID=UPI00263B78C9|nr:NAD(P)-dependent oxidoreductase [Eleftheria terrae]WKB53438.1 NAD(P)-dependent oxidoreductase [Eleftheria terrae]